ncbi:ninjurin-1-like isoform X2 [Babylonia areolata]|uniref:ninjurin-1-like isoform X2 n=1 Tax=Babylonia areolata TaxID=304850 RepID=UPI003FD6450F
MPTDEDTHGLGVAEVVDESDPEPVVVDMQRRVKPIVGSNSYATRKTVAQGALDFALLMTNASQLKALVDIPSNSRGNFFVGLLVLLGVSIAFQVSAGVVLLILGMMDPDESDEPAHKRAERLNNASVCIILIITIINVFISAFGISYVDNIPGTPAPHLVTTVGP